MKTERGKKPGNRHQEKRAEMGGIIYSLADDGNKKLSEHFTLREFACRDGSDGVKVDSKLLELLEKIRSRFGSPVTITSAYRTAAYNKKVGGAAQSRHLTGKAADIRVEGASFREVAVCAQELGAGGIGLYEYEGGFTHVDVRQGFSLWLQKSKNGSAVSVSGFEAAQPETAEEERKEEKPLVKSEPSAWAQEAAAWALKEGLIRGDENADPHWQEALTREQLAVILKRLYDKLS